MGEGTILRLGLLAVAAICSLASSPKKPPPPPVTDPICSPGSGLFATDAYVLYEGSPREYHLKESVPVYRDWRYHIVVEGCQMLDEACLGDADGIAPELSGNPAAMPLPNERELLVLGGYGGPLFKIGASHTNPADTATDELEERPQPNNWLRFHLNWPVGKTPEGRSTHRMLLSRYYPERECSVCGDGIKNGPEACDDANTVTEDSCPYGAATCTTCTADCMKEESRSGPICGDGMVNGPAGTEACDDGNSLTSDCCGSCAIRSGLSCIDGTPLNCMAGQCDASGQCVADQGPACPSGQTCFNGSCCTPDCTGGCGSDGCGGLCGCPSGKNCDGGICKCTSLPCSCTCDVQCPANALCSGGQCSAVCTSSVAPFGCWQSAHTIRSCRNYNPGGTCNRDCND